MPSLTQVAAVPPSWQDPLLSRQAAAELLTQPHHSLFVIQDDQQPTAPLHAHLLARTVPGTVADVLTLHTHPDLRRKGYAMRLMAALIPYAHQQGCTAITLEVRASNHPAVSLYQLCGFTQTHTRPNYYQNPTEDALILSLDLPE